MSLQHLLEFCAFNGYGRWILLSTSIKNDLLTTATYCLSKGKGDINFARAIRGYAARDLNLDKDVPVVTEKFSVTTYNVLTGPRLGSNPNKPSIYEHETPNADPSYIRWKDRKYLVFEALQRKDVVMLNEVTRPMLHDIIKATKLAKAGFELKKDGNYDGSAILFDPKVFTLITKFGSRLISGWGQVLLCAILRSNESGKELAVMSLHLKSGYADYERIRKDQFKAAMNVFKKSKWGGLPLVVGGDLNSDYRDKTIHDHKGGALVDQMTKKYDLVDTCLGDCSRKGRPVTYNQWHPSVFDYILVTRKDFSILSYEVPSAGTDRGAPNKYQGSDHFPVTVELSLK